MEKLGFNIMEEGQQQDNKQQPQMQVVIPENLVPVYANMVQVGSTLEEFIIDFMFLAQPQGKLMARVVLTPEHFERVVQALTDNLKKFKEAKTKESKKK